MMNATPMAKMFHVLLHLELVLTQPNLRESMWQGSLREERIKNISSAIQSHDETTALLQKQKQKYSNTEKYLEAAEINKSILEMTHQKQLKVKELAELSKAEARSDTTKKRKKMTKEMSSNLPKVLGAWLKRESSAESGGDTNIIITDESGDEVSSGDQTKVTSNERNRGFYSGR